MSANSLLANPSDMLLVAFYIAALVALIIVLPIFTRWAHEPLEIVLLIWILACTVTFGLVLTPINFIAGLIFTVAGLAALALTLKPVTKFSIYVEHRERWLAEHDAESWREYAKKLNERLDT